MVWNSISRSRLKLIVQTQLNFYSCYPFLINNCNMAGSSVEKYKVFVLNVKLVVKRRFKRFYLLENLFQRLLPCTPLPIQFVLPQIFPYPSNKSVVYGPELNL